MKKFFLVFLTISCSAFAQITINSSDIANAYAVGNSTTLNNDTQTSNVDIGSTGGQNNWDFSNLQSNITGTFTSVDPASSPYIADFSGADYVTHSESVNQDTTIDLYSYIKLNGTLDFMGSGSTINLLPGFVTMITDTPFRTQAVFPVTFNSNWSNNFTQSLVIILNGTPFSTINSTVSTSTIVDAYGTMTLPGGSSYDALRLKEVTTITTNGSSTTSTNFNFMTREGALVSISAMLSNPPDNGVIAVDNIGFGGALITDVEKTNAIPDNYSLSQNYPNPFNPSTKIEYSIPSESFVSLKVYDILGNEVATIVNEQQQAGVYRADFNAANLPSGLYFARLTANNFTQVVKMTLLK